MLVQKIISIMERFDNPNYPLLGPDIRGLYWIGIWQGEDKRRNSFFNFVYFFFGLFVVSEFVEQYFMGKDLIKVILNSSFTILSVVSTSKVIFFLINLPHWKSLVENISREEISALENNEPNVIDLMNRYKSYSRVITFFYSSVVLTTSLLLILFPFLKYLIISSYREMIKNGTEPYPQILHTWFPFDQTKMPGYLVAVIVHVTMTFLGAAITAFYDSTAVVTMVFLKGQLQILRYKCEHIFGDSENISNNEVMNNIKECHRLHNFITEQHKTFNTILSPPMFIYVLVCSIMICLSVVQLSMKEVALLQKLMVLEYTTALSIELFLFCWHSNEIAYESYSVDQGVYSSNWWRSDVYLRKQVLLLAGKLSPTFIVDAGPFVTFSTSTFINILKGSYSFYTLFTQMRND